MSLPVPEPGPYVDVREVAHASAFIAFRQTRRPKKSCAYGSGIHRAVGTLARIEWDRLRMDPEILVPPDTAEFLTRPNVIYPPGTSVRVDDADVVLGQLGPLAVQKGPAQ